MAIKLGVNTCCAVPLVGGWLVSFIFRRQRWFFGIAVKVEKSEELRKALLDCGYSEKAATKVVDCYAQFLNC
jgi:hypothetical protein